MSAKHPNSDALRALADWMDENGHELSVLGVSVDLVQETPEAFGAFIKATAAAVDSSLQHVIFARGQACGLSIHCSAMRDKVGTKRVVAREEYVFGEQA